MIRRLTAEDRADLEDLDGARMHTDSRIWPEHQDASQRARVRVDDEPLCYEHHRGPVDWYELWGEKV